MTPIRWRRSAVTLIVASAVVLLLAAVLGACGSSGGSPEPTATVTVTSSATSGPSGSASPTSGGSPSPSSTATTRLTVYFVRATKMGAVHRWVPQTTQVATAAMNQLLMGLQGSEPGNGLYSTIPAGTTLRGLAISGGVATVDLSSAFAGGSTSPKVRGQRVSQVVFTLTQFPSVHSVIVKVNGTAPSGFGAAGIDLTTPQSRAKLEAYAPAILVESPAINDTVSSPVTISGSANTFEGSFMAQVMNAAGDRIVAKPVQATSGSGTRGTFSKTITFSTSDSHGSIVVWEVSAKDGTPTHVVRIPVKFD